MTGKIFLTTLVQQPMTSWFSNWQYSSVKLDVRSYLLKLRSSSEETKQNEHLMMPFLGV